jgi:hypothetical protein
MEEQGCGYALRIWTADLGEVLDLLNRNRISMRRVYHQIPGGHLEEIHL